MKLRGFFRACFLAPFLGGFRAAFGLRVVERKQLSMCYRVRRGGPFWPSCGPENGGLMFTLFLWTSFSCAQALAAWQWFNCMSNKLPAGKTVLRINMDETSVCLWQGQGKGTVLFRKRRDPPGAESVQRADRSKRRTCMTYVAFICDGPELQPLLPHVIIGKCGTFLARDFPDLQAASPANVELIRQESAWNDARLQARIVRKLGLALRPVLGDFQPVLLMDAVLFCSKLLSSTSGQVSNRSV